MADGEEICVFVDVTNTGKRFGKEVLQLYVSPCNAANRPVMELKGFTKLALAPGETKTAAFTISARDLSYFEESIHDWYVPSGTYSILVGEASDRIAARADLHFETKRPLLCKVKGDTTVNQLLSDARTAPIIHMLLPQLRDAPENNSDAEGLGESGAEMLRTMLLNMPLKSLMGFIGAGQSRLEELMHDLNAAIS